MSEQNNNVIDQIKAAKNEYNIYAHAALVECTTDSKKLSDFLNLMTNFSNLSIKNCLALYNQNPNAKEVLSVEIINKYSGRIISGEKGISLLAPKTVENNEVEKTYYNVKKFFDVSQITLPKPTQATKHRDAVKVLSSDYINISNAIKGVSDSRFVYTYKSEKSHYDYRNKISYIYNKPSNEKIVYDMIKNLVTEKGYFGTVKGSLREQYINLVAHAVASKFGIESPDLNLDIFKDCTEEDALNILNTVKEQSRHLITSIEYELFPQVLYKNYDITYDSLKSAIDKNGNPLYNNEQLHQFKTAIDKNFNPAELSILCFNKYSTEVISQGIRSISENMPLSLVNSLLRNYNSQQISAIRLIYQTRPSNKRMSMILNPALSGLQLYALHRVLVNDLNRKIDDDLFTRLCSGFFDNQQLETIAIILTESDITVEQLNKIADNRLDSPTMISIKEAYLSGVDEFVINEIIANNLKNNKSAEISQLLNEVVNKHNADKNVIKEDDYSLDSLLSATEYEATEKNNEMLSKGLNRQDISASMDIEDSRQLIKN